MLSLRPPLLRSMARGVPPSSASWLHWRHQNHHHRSHLLNISGIAIHADRGLNRLHFLASQSRRTAPFLPMRRAPTLPPPCPQRRGLCSSSAPRIDDAAAAASVDAATKPASKIRFLTRILRVGAAIAALGLLGGYVWRADLCEARLQEPSLQESLMDQSQPIGSSDSLVVAPSESLKLLLQEQPSGIIFVEGSSELATSTFVRATLASRPCVVYLSMDAHLAHSPEGLVRYIASSLGIYTVSSYCFLRELLGSPMTTREDVDYCTRVVVAMLTEALRAIRARDGKHFYPPTILVTHLDRFLDEAVAQGRLSPAGDNLVMHATVSFLSALETLAEQGLVHIIIPQAAGEAMRRSSAPGLLDAAWAHSRGLGRVSPASGASADEAAGPRVFTLRQLHVDEVESFLWAQIFHPKSFDADAWRHRNFEELRNIKFSLAYESFKASRPADFAAIVAISELLQGNQSLIEKYVAMVRTMAAERLVAASLTLDPRFGAVPESASPSTAPSSGATVETKTAPTDIMDYVNPDVLRKAFCRLVDHQSHNTARALMEMLSRPNEVSLVPYRPAGPHQQSQRDELDKRATEHGTKIINNYATSTAASSEECFLGDQSPNRIDSPSAQGRSRETEDDASSLDTDAYDRLFDISQDDNVLSVPEFSSGKIHQYSGSPLPHTSGAPLNIIDSLLRKLFKQIDDGSSPSSESQKSVLRDGYTRWSQAVMRGVSGRRQLVEAGSEETDTSMYDNDTGMADSSSMSANCIVGKPMERMHHGGLHSEGPSRSWRLQLKYLLRALIDMSLQTASGTSPVAPSSAAAAFSNPSSIRVPTWQFVAEYLHGDPELLWFMLDNRLIRLTPMQPMHERSEEERSLFRDADRSSRIQGFSFSLDSAQHIYQVEFYSPMVRRAVEALLLDGTNHLQDVLTAKAPVQSNYRTHHSLTQSSRDHRATKSLKGPPGDRSSYHLRGIAVIGYEGRGSSNRSKETSTADNRRGLLTYSMKELPFLSSTDRTFLASCDSKLQRVSSCDLQFLDAMEMGLARGAGQLLGVCGGDAMSTALAPSAHASASAAATSPEMNRLAEKRLIQFSMIHGVLSVSDVQEVLAAAGRVYARRDLETALSALLMDKRVIIPRDLIALLERNRALGEMAMGTAVQQPPSNPPVYPGNHSRIM